MSRDKLVVGLFLSMIVAGSISSAVFPQAHASNPDQVRCGLTITPTWKYVAQGGSGDFNVSVFCSSGGPTIELVYSPPTVGIFVSFSTNKQPAPYSSTMTVSVDASKPAGNYTVEVWAHTSGAQYFGPLDSYQNVFVLVVPPPSATSVATTSAAETDWALSNAFVTPSNPTQGATVTFTATLQALTTTNPFPQTVQIEVLGTNIMGTFTVTYNGPIGSPMPVTKTEPVTTPGQYTVSMYADPPLPYQYNDPNRSNNAATVTFTVAAAGASVITTTITTSSSMFVTAWSASSTTEFATGWTASTANPQFTVSGYNLPSTTQAYPMNAFGINSDLMFLLVGIIVVLVVVVAKLRHQSPSSPQTQTGTSTAALTCPTCGARLSIGQTFCKKCGTKLQ